MLGAPHHQKLGNQSDPLAARVRLEAMQEARMEMATTVVLQMKMLIRGRTASC